MSAAARNIVTAEEWQRRLAADQRRQTLERKRDEAARAAIEDSRDLRDDTMSLIRNSGLSFEQIHAACGPHPSTLKAWDEKRVSTPRMTKLRAALRTIGKDLIIGDYREAKDAR